MGFRDSVHAAGLAASIDDTSPVAETSRCRATLTRVCLACAVTHGGRGWRQIAATVQAQLPLLGSARGLVEGAAAGVHVLQCPSVA